ncbi:MAG: hypothetical protein JRJ84_00540 [Deltaproteobacteria bacterium]|nr:hypothetical protein [Deltaproteobacteria bacterium]
MSRFLAPAVAMLVACSTGLTPLLTEEEDTGIPPVGPDDTGIGEPIDTADTADANLDPVADAGQDQTGTVGDVIQLDGSASFDPDGDEVGFLWEMMAKPASSNSTLINFRRADPEFYADRGGTYTVQLIVDDGLLTATDEVDVVIEAPNDVPVADAGPDQAVSMGDTVQLNGDLSYDPDGGTLSYQWTLTSQPTSATASLTAANSPLPRFTAAVAGTYVAELVVNDGTFDSAPDTVRVVAQSDDDGDCLTCTAAARQELHRRLTLGNAASGPGLVLLPLLVFFWQRKID